MDGLEMMDAKRAKTEALEVTGVSRCGRVRKKSSKLMDFESPDDVENRHKRKSNFDVSAGNKQRKTVKSLKLKSNEGLEDVSHETLHDDQDEMEYNVPAGDSDSDNESDVYRPGLSEDADDVADDLSDEDYTEGQLVVDDKTPVSQSLYMMEKSKKKLVMRDGRVVPGKPHRKDKGKARLTAYMMWAREVRLELNKQYPDMDFTTMARRLSELWATVPNSERELWRRKAKREALKKQKAKPEAPLMPNRKFINKKGGPIQPPVNMNSQQAQLQQKTVSGQVGHNQRHAVAPSEPPSQKLDFASPLRKPAEAVTGTGLYKVTGMAPIDVAAHLKLLGESLSIIGERLQEHEGQIAVSGSLSVLLDSLLCAVGPLLCLTQQVEEIQSNKQVLSGILQNVAYMMPGLG